MGPRPHRLADIWICRHPDGQDPDGQDSDCQLRSDPCETPPMSMLKIERRDRVAILTFDDPDRRNVISNELNDELHLLQMGGARTPVARHNVAIHGFVQ